METRKRTYPTADKRRWHLKNRYGITPEQWDEMYERQGGACAICRESKRLCVDHDHETGQVRGLLCHGCNTSVEWFLRYDWEAAQYVRGLIQET